MALSSHPQPQGIWGTILLPITEHDQIDWGALAEELDVLAASGLAGIYANGTAGEFHNQTEAEYERLVDLVAQKAQAAGMPFQIGVSNTNPRVARSGCVDCSRSNRAPPSSPCPTGGCHRRLNSNNSWRDCKRPLATSR